MFDDLPAEIQYLGPVLEELDAYPDEDFGDENNVAAEAVERTVRNHVAGLEEDEAIGVLQSNIGTLQEYASRGGSSAVHFVLGVLLGMTIYNGYE